LIRSFILSFIFLNTAGFSAEVIGIEKPGRKSRVKSDSEEPAYAEASQQEEKPRRRRREQHEQSSRDDGERNWGLTGSLGLGFKSFSASITVSRYFNRYIGLDLSGFYRTRSWEDKKETEYGPELDLVLRLPNPTIITPFVGAGPGWIKWQRQEKDIDFDTSASFTANYFVGANLKMTDFLVFQASYKWITYLNLPPYKFEDHSKREERQKNEFSVGLAVII